MPNKLKSFQNYIRKIKTPTSRSFSSLLKACKHPRTASFVVDRSNHGGDKPTKDEAATLYDIDQFLLENFRSLYLENGDDNLPLQRQQEQQENIFGNSDENKLDLPSRIHGSHRFFVAIAPSSSLLEEARLSLTKCSHGGKILAICDGDSDGDGDDSTSGDDYHSTSGDEDNEYGDKDEEDIISDEIEYVIDDYTTVRTYSWNPYSDFRRSMEEMIEAKLEEDGKIDWDFMEELLVCYLNLNEKRSLKFIVNAFVDLVVSLRRDHGELISGERGRNPAGKKLVI